VVESLSQGTQVNSIESVFPERPQRLAKKKHMGVSHMGIESCWLLIALPVSVPRACHWPLKFLNIQVGNMQGESAKRRKPLEFMEPLIALNTVG